ncbi:hypothetical protein PQR39_35690 [Paraburkholderia sediminicola]|uniref:hypothetical protein n=1 Tax=Paraburkholderia sediminicola TaxID=458836 RepID=UPI0038BBB695
MPQVLNRNKNASTVINGIAFTPTKNGMLSEEITQDQADYFLKIPTYVAVKAPAAKAPATPPSDPAAAAAVEAEREAAERANAAAQAAAQEKQQA